MRWPASRGPGQRAEAGSSTVEFALALPLLLAVLVGTVQFALVLHARSVVETAAIEGARRAAAAGAAPADGAERARALLEAGLGPAGGAFTVGVEERGDLVVTRVRGSYALFIPWVSELVLPLEATGSAWREEFRDGP